MLSTQNRNSLSKRQWGELFAVRIERWKKRFTLRQLSSGAKALKLLLPAEAGNVLGTVSDVPDEVSKVVGSPPSTTNTQ
jgi:hypothetical protein